MQEKEISAIPYGAVPINQPLGPMELISVAVQRGDSVENMKQLLELKREHEKDEARKAFHKAMASFKSESLDITKNKKVSFKAGDGTTEYNHATLDHILEMTVPLLSKHGLSHKWATEQGEGGRITVTCVLTHELGHSDSVALTASPDDSGKKNNIQRVASTVTYLERYTFLAITGLAARDQDDDGVASGDRFDKKAYEQGMKFACETYGHAWYEHHDVISAMKDLLADDNILGAAEVYFSLTPEEQMYIFCAPTKGGIFTLEEAKKMKKGDPEWEEACREAIRLNPDVERGI